MYYAHTACSICLYHTSVYTYVHKMAQGHILTMCVWLHSHLTPEITYRHTTLDSHSSQFHVSLVATWYQRPFESPPNYNFVTNQGMYPLPLSFQSMKNQPNIWHKLKIWVTWWICTYYVQLCTMCEGACINHMPLYYLMILEIRTYSYFMQLCIQWLKKTHACAYSVHLCYIYVWIKGVLMCVHTTQQFYTYIHILCYIYTVICICMSICRCVLCLTR